MNILQLLGGLVFGYAGWSLFRLRHFARERFGFELFIFAGAAFLSSATVLILFGLGFEAEFRNLLQFIPFF
jgi:hypothetical protein